MMPCEVRSDFLPPFRNWLKEARSGWWHVWPDCWSTSSTATLRLPPSRPPEDGHQVHRCTLPLPLATAAVGSVALGSGGSFGLLPAAVVARVILSCALTKGWARLQHLFLVFLLFFLSSFFCYFFFFFFFFFFLYSLFCHFPRSHAFLFLWWWSQLTPACSGRAETTNQIQISFQRKGFR